MTDDPSYEELYEENLELLEDKEKLNQHVRVLESELAEGRDAGRQGEQAAATLERVRADLTRARDTATERSHELELIRGERESWTGERARLEQVLHEKEEILRHALRDSEKRDEEKDHKREERRKQSTLQREVMDAVNENERMRAEISTLNSQISVLQGALTVAAAERDEILAMRDKSDANLEDVEARLEGLQLTLEEMNAQLQEVTMERNTAEQTATKERLHFQASERSLRLELESSLAECNKLRETTVAGAHEQRLEQVQIALDSERAEAERLDAENVELAVLADFLRQRIVELENGEAVGSGAVGRVHATLEATEQRLRESEVRQRGLENEIAGLEAELADDRELIDLAAKKGGIGVAETIRRNKRIKAVLRERDSELEKTSDQYTAQLETNKKLHAAQRRYKAMLDDAANALSGAACSFEQHEIGQICQKFAALDHKFDDLELHGDARSYVTQLKAVCAQMELQINDLEEERLRLLQRLRDTAVHAYDGGVWFLGLSHEQTELVRSYVSSLLANATKFEVLNGGRGNEPKQESASRKVNMKEDKMRIVSLEDKLSTARRALKQARDTGGDNEGSSNGHSGVVPGFDSIPELTQMRNELRLLAEELRTAHENEVLKRPHMSKLLQLIDMQERNSTELAVRLEDAQQKIVALQVGGVERRCDTDRISSAHLPPTQPTAIGALSTPHINISNPADSSLHGPFCHVQGESASFTFGDVTVSTRVSRGQRGPITQATTTHNFRGSIPQNVRTPATPHSRGREAQLENQLRVRHNLPHDTWAVELHDIYSSFAETLEALSVSGRECADQGMALAMLGGQASLARQHVSTLYDEHLAFLICTEETERRYQSELSTVREEKAIAKVNLENYQALAEVEAKNDATSGSGALKLECRELMQRVSSYETNELMLKRRYSILDEERFSELARREKAEQALGELEATLRGRILYLELWKQGASARIERLQAELSDSVPSPIAALRASELKSLREEHVQLIRDSATQSAKLARLREVPRIIAHARESANDTTVANISVGRDKDALDREQYEARNGVGALPETRPLMVEIALLRGDKRRLEIEVVSAREVAEAAQMRAQIAAEDSDHPRKSYVAAEDEPHKTRDGAYDAGRNDVCNTLCGFTANAEQINLLRTALRNAKDDAAAARREAFRLAERASIASAQGAHLSRQRDERDANCNANMQLLKTLEAHSDDNRLIGKLQRELIAVRATYRLFASKYETLRSQLRRKEAAACKAEAQLDIRDEALVALHDERREQINALRSALGEMSRCVTPTCCSSSRVAAGRYTQVSADIHLGAKSNFKNMFHDRVDLARHLGREIAELNAVAESREAKLCGSELARERLEERVAVLELERDTSQQILTDVKSTVGLGIKENSTDSRKSSAGVAARRLISLSEDIRAVKIQALNDRRELKSLREEKRRLDAALVASEDKLSAADRARVEAETRALLLEAPAISDYDIQNQTMATLPLPSLADPLAFAALASELGMAHAKEDGALSGDMARVAAEQSGKRAAEAHQSTLQLANELRDAHAAFRAAKTLEQEALRHSVELLHALEYYERVITESHILANDVYFTGLARAKDHVNRRALECDIKSIASIAAPSYAIRPKIGLKQHFGDKPEQDRLQHVASTTIASLRALVEEKNLAVARSNGRLEDLREASRCEAATDRAEIERLTEKLYHEHENAIDQLRGVAAIIERAPSGLNSPSGDEILLAEVTAEMREIRRLNRDLERNLQVANHARKRAEERYSGSLREINAQKSDLVALAAQLHRSEEHRDCALDEKSSRAEVLQLKRSLAEKQAKLRGLRQALVALKLEFVAAYEARATEVVKAGDVKGVESDGAVTKLRSTVDELKAQLRSVRNEARASRLEVEKVQAQHKKLSAQVKRMNDEAEIRDRRSRSAETRARELDNALTEARHECRELKASEAELRREKRDIVGGTCGEEAKGNLSDLKRELVVLRAQNEALRSDVVSGIGVTSSLLAKDRALGGNPAGHSIVVNIDERGLKQKDKRPMIEAKNHVELDEAMGSHRSVEYLRKMLLKRDLELDETRMKERAARALLEKIQMHHDKSTTFRRQRELESIIAELQRTLHRSNVENQRLSARAVES